MIALLSLPLAAAATPVCTGWGESVDVGSCPAVQVNESSGLSYARRRSGTWFTHNDAGGTPALYAFQEDGTLVETHNVVGAAFRDWEDISGGPCPFDLDAGPCIYIGDIGDNGESRSEIAVYVVAEPAAGEPAQTVAFWRLTYPEGSQDAEALAVQPCSGQVYLFTKSRDGGSRVYRLPERVDDALEPQTLEFVTELDRAWLGDNGLVTGADWSPGGHRLVVRTYGGAWEWQTDPADPEGHWNTPPTPIPIDPSGQGESVAWHPDGGLLCTTEGVPMRVLRLACSADTELPACPDRPPPDTGAVPDSNRPDSGAAMALAMAAPAACWGWKRRRR